MYFKILLIDSNQKSKETITNLIGGKQVSIYPTSNASDGLIILKDNNKFDLILLDLECGGIDYFDDFYNYDIPIIVMAEQDNEELALSMIRRGAQDYLVKNGVLNPRGLRRVILHAVERNGFVKNTMECVSNREITIARDALRKHRLQIEHSIAEIGAFNAAFQKHGNQGIIEKLLK